MKVAPDDYKSKMSQLSLQNNQGKSINVNQSIICSYVDFKSIQEIDLFVSAATKIPDFQFVLIIVQEQNFIDSQSILERSDNLFVIDKVASMDIFFEFIDLAIILSNHEEQYDYFSENTVVFKIPTLYFDPEGKNSKQLSDRYSYVISEKPNLDLLLLFIKRLFDRDDDISPESQLMISSKSTVAESLDIRKIPREEKMIEEQTTVDYSSQAANLQDQGDIEGAILNYKQAIKQDSHQPAWVYCNIVACLNLLGEFDEAIVIGQKGTLLHPEAADLYRSLGLVYNQKGDSEGVLENYNKAVKLEPQQPFWLYCALIELLTLKNDFDEAVDISRQGITLYPDKADLYHHFGFLLYKKNDLELAIEQLEQAVRLKPDHFWSNHLLGEILLKHERWQESSYFLQQATKIKEDYIWSHYHLGEALFREEKWNESISSYQKFLQFQSDSTEVLSKINLAIDKLISSSLQKSEAEYLQELKDKPNDLNLYFGLANVFTQQSRLNKALAFLQIILKQHPQRLDAQVLLQKVLDRKTRLYQAFQIDAEDHLYDLWLKENRPKPEHLDWMPEIVNSLGYKPLISIIVPTYNAPENFLREMIQSVLDQIYPYWELCIADDASPQPHVKLVLEEYANKYDNIKVVFRTENGHISAASNSALELASGEFITLLDHDDLLTPDALYEVVLLLNQHPQAEMIYSDEDKLNENNQLKDPYFKPDWCPDSFLARNYICHLGTYRRKIINEIGGFRLGYEGAQDYDLVLRFTEKTNNIFHIPKVLYHWRIHSSSSANGSEAKPYAYDAGTKALEDALVRRNEPGTVVNNDKLPGVYTIRYEIKEYKLVSIIIPTRNLGDVLERCLESIFEKSSYPNFEIVIIDNGTDDPETLAMFERWQQQEPERFFIYRLDIPFNYSRLNNYGVSFAKGDYLLFLNNDTEIITPDWIEAMVEQTQRQSVGVVGAKLLYPDDTIQHAGVVVGLGGVAGHSHKHFPADHLGYVRQLWSVNNYSAVTAACVMCRREVFEEVAGFDETLKVAFNDVDFCLKVQSKGYHNICLPHVLLYHYESKSRGYEDTPEKQARFLREMGNIKQKWGKIIASDPCYSPNLTRSEENYGLNIQAKVKILEVISEPNNPEKLYGFHIDTPQSQENVVGVLVVSGWVLGHNSPVTQVEVISEQKVTKVVNVEQPRADVSQVFPHVPEAINCGFKLAWNLIDLLQETKLSVRALHQDNGYSPLGVIQLSH